MHCWACADDIVPAALGCAFLRGFLGTFAVLPLPVPFVSSLESLTAGTESVLHLIFAAAPFPLVLPLLPLGLLSMDRSASGPFSFLTPALVDVLARFALVPARS